MKIKSVKKWDVEPRDGKHAYSVTFEEHHSTPVDYFSTIEPKIGDVVEGKVGTSEKGRPTFYPKEPFVLDQRQALIMAQWSTAQALQFVADHTNLEEVYDLSEAYFDIVVKLGKAKSE